MKSKNKSTINRNNVFSTINMINKPVDLENKAGLMYKTIKNTINILPEPEFNRGKLLLSLYDKSAIVNNLSDKSEKCKNKVNFNKHAYLAVHLKTSQVLLNKNDIINKTGRFLYNKLDTMHIESINEQRRLSKELNSSILKYENKAKKNKNLVLNLPTEKVDINNLFDEYPFYEKRISSKKSFKRSQNKASKSYMKNNLDSKNVTPKNELLSNDNVYYSKNQNSSNTQFNMNLNSTSNIKSLHNPTANLVTITTESATLTTKRNNHPDNYYTIRNETNESKDVNLSNLRFQLNNKSSNNNDIILPKASKKSNILSNIVKMKLDNLKTLSIENLLKQQFSIVKNKIKKDYNIEYKETIEENKNYPKIMKNQLDLNINQLESERLQRLAGNEYGQACNSLRESIHKKKYQNIFNKVEGMVDKLYINHKLN